MWVSDSVQWSCDSVCGHVIQCRWSCDSVCGHVIQCR